MSATDPDPARHLLVAPNPDADSKLPFLISLPLPEGPLVLKSREPWPSTARVYCHRHDGAFPSEGEIVAHPVRVCTRRGPAIDLVLDRAREKRSQFVITQMRGREMIFWQTPATAKAARPGARIPRRRPDGFGAGRLQVVVDSRERYPYTFAGRPVDTAREALAVGDYAVVDERYEVICVVERKSFDDACASLSDGSLAFVAAELAALPAAAIVIEGRYGRLLDHAHTPGGYLADQLTRIQSRVREVPIVFCDTRKHAEDYTFRFLAQSLVEHGRRHEDDGVQQSLL